jgi:hypothetical protein
MAFTVVEAWDGYQLTGGENPQVAARYIVTGTDADVNASDSAAYAAAIAVVPATANSLPLVTLQVERLLKDAGKAIWTASATYRATRTGSPQSRELDVPDTIIDQYSTGGRQETIRQGTPIDSTSRSGATIPDYGGLINVTDQGVEGVEVVAPKLVWTRTKTFAAGEWDASLRSNLALLTGSVNNASFEGWAAGELLLVSTSASQRNSGVWEVTYTIEVSRNQTGIVIADFDAINKDGWDYLWVLYAKTEDATADTVVRTPIAAYVDRVYPRRDFALLEMT